MAELTPQAQAWLARRRLAHPRTEAERQLRHLGLYGTAELPPRGTGPTGNPGPASIRIYQPSEATTNVVVGQGDGRIVGDTLLASYGYGENLGEFYITVRNQGDADAVFRVEIWDRTVDPWINKTITRDVPIAAGQEYAFRFGDALADPTVDGDTFDFYPAAGEVDGSYNLEAKIREGFWPFYSYRITHSVVKTLQLRVEVATRIVDLHLEDEAGNPITGIGTDQPLRVVGTLQEAQAPNAPIDTVGSDRVWISRRRAVLNEPWEDVATVGTDASGTIDSGLHQSPLTAGTYEYWVRFLGESALAAAEAFLTVPIGISTLLFVMPAAAIGAVIGYAGTRRVSVTVLTAIIAGVGAYLAQSYVPLMDLTPEAQAWLTRRSR